MELNSRIFEVPAKAQFRPVWIILGLAVLAQLFLVTGISIWFAREVSVLKDRISALETEAKMVQDKCGTDIGNAFRQVDARIVINKPMVDEVAPKQSRVNDIDQTTAGAVYVRWGRSDCPSSSSLLYMGEAAGSNYKNSGGGSNYQCLPENPDYVMEQDKAFRTKIYGAEYQDGGQPTLYDHNVPCAVCMANHRGSMVMIPAKITCPDSSWTREYQGYLMTAAYQNYRTTFECVDQDRQALNGTGDNANGALLFNVEGNCEGEGELFFCPKYQPSRALTCVVCTK